MHDTEGDMEFESGNAEGTSGKLVLLLLLAWVTIALGGYYIALRMIL